MFKNVCVNVPEKISITKHQCVRHSTPLGFCLWYSPLKDSWRIPWSSYKKLAWEKLQPISTYIHSIPFRCSDWAIRPWVQLATRASFVKLLWFHHFVQCQISFWLLPLLVVTFILIKILICVFVFLVIFCCLILNVSL